MYDLVEMYNSDISVHIFLLFVTWEQNATTRNVNSTIQTITPMSKYHFIYI